MTSNYVDKSRLPSRYVTEGPERAPHRSYLYAMGLTSEQIHQPLIGGLAGQATDVEIHARELIKTKEKLARMLAEHCGQPFDRVMADTERDNFMSAQEAKEYGIIDAVFERRAS